MRSFRIACFSILLAASLAWLTACRVVPAPGYPGTSFGRTSEPKQVAEAKTMPELPETIRAEAVELAAGATRYYLQPDSPTYLANFARPDACAWQGIAGQTFAIGGGPATGLRVIVGGTMGGRALGNYSTTGNAISYGPAGYEIDLGLAPEGSIKTAWVQVTAADGSPRSDKFYFDTFSDCQKNLILINFMEQGEFRYRLPIIFR